MFRHRNNHEPQAVPELEQQSVLEALPSKERHGRRPRWPLIVIGVILLAGAGGVWLGVSRSTGRQNNSAVTQPQAAAATRDKTIRLIASGDELPHDSVNANAATTSGYDYTPFFSNVMSIFSQADIRFCNQEVPSAAPDAGPVSGYPTFNAPTQFAKDLHTVGCNVINLATNHTNDKHQAGIDTTRSTWEALKPLAVAGANRSTAEQQQISYFTVKGVKFAFLAYNFYNNDTNVTSYGVNMFDETLVKQQLDEAKAAGAYILVSMHWGTEYSPTIDDTQVKWAQFLADNGADMVLGTGPHVLEPVQELPKAGGGKTVVWFSLGNLLNTQLDIESLIGGFAVMDFRIKDQKVTLDNISFLPTYMHYEWTAAQKTAEDLLARKNLKLYPLDQSAVPLARSLNSTTVEAQTERVSQLLNTYMSVSLMTSTQY